MRGANMLLSAIAQTSKDLAWIAYALIKRAAAADGWTLARRTSACQCTAAWCRLRFWSRLPTSLFMGLFSKFLTPPCTRRASR